MGYWVQVTDILCGPELVLWPIQCHLTHAVPPYATMLQAKAISISIASLIQKFYCIRASVRPSFEGAWLSNHEGKGILLHKTSLICAFQAPTNHFHRIITTTCSFPSLTLTETELLWFNPKCQFLFLNILTNDGSHEGPLSPQHFYHSPYYDFAICIKKSLPWIKSFLILRCRTREFSSDWKY